MRSGRPPSRPARGAAPDVRRACERRLPAPSRRAPRGCPRSPAVTSPIRSRCFGYSEAAAQKLSEHRRRVAGQGISRVRPSARRRACPIRHRRGTIDVPTASRRGRHRTTRCRPGCPRPCPSPALAMQAGAPSTMPRAVTAGLVMVGLSERPSAVALDAFTSSALARPKSSTLTAPSSVTFIFAGLRSR